MKNNKKNIKSNVTSASNVNNDVIANNKTKNYNGACSASLIEEVNNHVNAGILSHTFSQIDRVRIYKYVFQTS